MSTGYGKHFVTMLGEFDLKAKSTFAEQIRLGNARSDGGGEVDLHINHRGRIRGWFNQRGARGSIGFGQFELTVDIEDLILLQELFASHDYDARNG